MKCFFFDEGKDPVVQRWSVNNKPIFEGSKIHRPTVHEEILAQSYFLRSVRPWLISHFIPWPTRYHHGLVQCLHLPGRYFHFSGCKAFPGILRPRTWFPQMTLKLSELCQTTALDSFNHIFILKFCFPLWPLFTFIKYIFIATLWKKWYFKLHIALLYNANGNYDSSLLKINCSCNCSDLLLNFPMKKQGLRHHFIITLCFLRKRDGHAWLNMLYIVS